MIFFESSSSSRGQWKPDNRIARRQKGFWQAAQNIGKFAVVAGAVAVGYFVLPRFNAPTTKEADKKEQLGFIRVYKFNLRYCEFSEFIC